MCVAALGVLLVRGVPPRLPQIDLETSVHSFPDHEHRLLFDHQDFQWGAFSTATQPTPPPAASPHLIAAVASSFEIVRDGWHFNRPPPVVR